MSATDLSIFETPSEEINALINKADSAFRIYRTVSFSDKAAFLETIAALIDNNRAGLCERAEKETALPRGRLEVEIKRTIDQLHLFSALLTEGSWVRAIIDHAEPSRMPVPKPDLRQMQQPIGPVAVFGASNFPFAYSVMGGDSVAALAAGCPVVYKSNPGHPETSDMVAALVIEAAGKCAIPEGVFSIVHGAGHETGRHLVTHPLIRAVGFTGSLRGGRALFDAAATRTEPIPVYAEMGSVNPVFILPEILREKGKEIARTLSTSNTSSVGQFCTNPGVVVSEPPADAAPYLAEFAKNIRKTPTAAMLNGSIFKSFESSIQQVSAKKHVSLMAVADDQTKGVARAHMFHTDATGFLHDEQLWEETFGPSSIQVTAENREDMLKVAAALPGQLTASVWGTENDLLQHRDLLELLEQKAGRVIINSVPTGVEVTAAMNHGGPYPATTDSKFTSVGTQSIYRFTRPVCYQNYPQQLLPPELRDDNPRKIWRLVNSVHSSE